jgi:hypothetical protein
LELKKSKAQNREDLVPLICYVRIVGTNEWMFVPTNRRDDYSVYS